MLCRGSCHQRRHFYPRSPCGERPYGALKHMHEEEISIHALLAESDGTPLQQYPQPGCYFYPRSPCGERLDKRCQFNGDNGFLSTLSLRRATINGLRHRWASFYFYPRSPCGERLRLFFIVFDLFRFLSTLSLRRATAKYVPSLLTYHHFYPRSPCGERRVC